MSLESSNNRNSPSDLSFFRSAIFVIFSFHNHLRTHVAGSVNLLFYLLFSVFLWLIVWYSFWVCGFGWWVAFALVVYDVGFSYSVWSSHGNCWSFWAENGMNFWIWGCWDWSCGEKFSERWSLLFLVDVGILSCASTVSAYLSNKSLRIINWKMGFSADP